MIKKTPGKLFFGIPHIWSRPTHICKYTDKLYEISETINHIVKYTSKCNFTFKYEHVVSFIKTLIIKYSDETINEIRDIQINKNEHIIDTCTIYISKEFLFSIDIIQENIQNHLISALTVLLTEDDNIDNKENYLFNFLYRTKIDFNHINIHVYYTSDILNILGNVLNYICEDSYMFCDYLYGSIRYIYKKYNDIDNIITLRGKYTYHEIKELMDDDVNNRVTSIQREYKQIYDFIYSLSEAYYINKLDDELKYIFKIIYNVETTQKFIENIKNRIDKFLNETLPNIPQEEYEKSNLKKTLVFTRVSVLFFHC